MEMEGTSKGGKKWEENIFWTHFQNIHFSQFLHGDFKQQLEIPKKFVSNLKTKLPQTVSLKGPSGNIWTVGLLTNNDTLFLKHGWSEFIEDHSLVQNDFLIFKYNKESWFEVLMFDGKNLCEKEHSYFVRKCEKVKETKECRSEKQDNGRAKNGSNSSIDGVGESMVEKSTTGDTLYMPSEEHAISESTTRNKRGWTKLNSRSNEPFRKRRARTRPGIERTSISRIRTDSRVLYLSNRRPVTEEEKMNALQRAVAALTDDSVTVVMRPTQVYKSFYATVPYKWSTKYLSMQDRNMILRVNENTWPAIYYCNEAHDLGKISSGWKNFAVENYLEEFDVCLFTPAGHMNGAFVMDVGIFRVVEEVIPPTSVDSLPSMSPVPPVPPVRRGRTAKKARN